MDASDGLLFLFVTLMSVTNAGRTSKLPRLSLSHSHRKQDVRFRRQRRQRRSLPLAGNVIFIIEAFKYGKCRIDGNTLVTRDEFSFDCLWSRNRVANEYAVIYHNMIFEFETNLT